MKSTVASRGQTVVPARLRCKYRIRTGTRLEWLDTGQDLRVIPLPEDLVGALRGLTRKENLGERLRQARRRDRYRERRR